MPDNITTSYIACRPPTNSTVPPGKTRFPLGDASLWPLGLVPSVLVFPEELDVERLKEAVGLLTTVWPSLGGRYESSPKAGVDGDYDFTLNFTSSLIPFVTQTTTAPPPAREVVLVGLEPLLPALGDQYWVPNVDSHLFAVCYTTFLPERSSALGVQWGHILGDGETVSRVLRHLEAFYLYGEAAVEKIDAGLGGGRPVFETHVDLPPYDPSTGLPYHQVEGHDPAVMKEAYAKSDQETEMMVLTLRREEIEGLKKKYREETGDRLSDQDCVSGWWVVLLLRAGLELENIIYVCSYRQFCTKHPAFPPTLAALAANVTQMRFIPIPKTSSGVNPASIASAVRKEIVKLRETPEITLPWIANAAHHLRQAALKQQGQVLVTKENEVNINSNIKLSWNFPFGFQPHQVAFHTSASIVRFLRVFQANPLEGEKLGDRVELIFNVPRGGVKEAVEKLFESDRAEWASEGAGAAV
ncbi:hypothetical protein IAT38_008089 [Cryptococcus sp. DSM 104549]